MAFLKKNIFVATFIITFFFYSSVVYAADKNSLTIYEIYQPIGFDEYTPIVYTTGIKPYGIIDQDMFYAYDGVRGRTFYGNNGVSSTRAGVYAKYYAQKDIFAFSQLEIGVSNNSSEDVSQINQSPGNTLPVRIAEVGFSSDKLGKLSLGHGHTASDDTADVDYSGTSVIAKSSVQKMGGSLIFSNTSNGALTGNPTVIDVFNNLNGLGRLNRIRYDTPHVGGFYASASLIQENQRDIALHYQNEFLHGKFAVAIAYANSSDINNRTPGHSLDGSTSFLLTNGINMTLAGGEIFANQSSRACPQFVYFKPGYQAHLNHFGNTNFSVDAGIFKNFSQNSDLAKTYGIDVVQRFNELQTVLYFGYRQFSLHQISASFNTIRLATMGIRIVF